MSQVDRVFTGSIPAIYDTYLVPLIFEGYAADIARRAAASSPNTVLEIAAGSGVVTRCLAPLLGPEARYTVTDLNQPMLDRAARIQGPDTRISWRQADALDLPFDNAAFDVVVCQFGVMFFPDRVRAYEEARRVLRPGGRLAFNVWDRIETSGFANIVTEAAGRVFAYNPMLFLARTPHGYHDVGVIRSELEQAGFSEVTIETIDATSTAPSPRHPAIAYCQGTPLRNEIEARGAGSLERVTDAAAAAIAARYGPGEVAAPIRAHVVTAAT